MNDAVRSIVTARDNAITLLRGMAKKEAEFEKWWKRSEEVDALTKERDEALEVAANAVRESEGLARTIKEKESELSTAQDQLKELQQDNAEVQGANSKLREQLEKKDQEALDKAAEAIEKFKGSQELRDLMDSRAALWAELTVRELRKAVIQNFGKCFQLVREDFDFIWASEIAEVVEKKVEQRWLRLLAKKNPALWPDQVVGLQQATSFLSLRSKDVSEVKEFCKFSLGTFVKKFCNFTSLLPKHFVNNIFAFAKDCQTKVIRVPFVTAIRIVFYCSLH